VLKKAITNRESIFISFKPGKSSREDKLSFIQPNKSKVENKTAKYPLNEAIRPYIGFP
jgi:hypothetical protein